jgi:GMP synthase-like glutamine amidotransferase
MKSLFVVGGCVGYANWLEEIGFKLTEDFESAEVFMFTGGEDVSPFLYGHEKLRGTGNNPTRDKFEVEYFNLALNKGKYMIGVCRGSQFLGAMSGGKLVQDMSHPPYHLVSTYDGGLYRANSTHHQGVYIPLSMVEGEDYKLLAWANNLSPFHTIADDTITFDRDYKETECTWWYKTKCFGVQSHPEWTLGSEWNSWLQQKVKEFIV